MKKNSVLIIATLLAVFIIGLTYDGYSTTVKHHNLKSLLTTAERIFVGKCVSTNEIELQFPKGTIWCTEYTFRISDHIKGNLGETLTFTQYGLMRPKKIDDNTIIFNRPVGMPIYEEGREYMLFLIGDSNLGLTSPAGLFQGAFLIYRDQFSRQVALNGSQNRGLFLNMAADEMKQFDLTQSEKKLAAKTKGPVILDDLVSMVKKFAQMYQ